METQKISDNEIKVIKTETVVKESIFTYEYLISQRKAIQDQKDRDNIQRDIELVEVDELLSECDKLEIAEKVAEAIVKEEPINV